MGAPTAAVVGLHGHGRSHLGNVLRLQAEGSVRLVGLVDPRPLTEADAADVVAGLPHGDGDSTSSGIDALTQTPWHADLDTLLERERPDVVVLVTPIHTHHELATRALEAGCDVLLEKPPTASLQEYEDLCRTAARTGGLVQVGFQTFGSQALPAIDDLVASGEIGDVTGVGAVGTWVRSTAYWTRSAWTGHRTLDGRAVVDGVVTNPLAHAVATALRLAGATKVTDVADVELDQYRANEIEADDTSVVRVTTAQGLPVTLGLTLCAGTHRSPRVIVKGTHGSAVLDYYTDTVEVHGVAGRRRLSAERADLLANLLRHRADPSVPLLCDLRDTGAFMTVLDAVRAAPDPVRIDPEHVDVMTDGDTTHLVVRDVEEWCRRAAAEHATFAELRVPWAVDPTRRSLP